MPQPKWEYVLFERSCWKPLFCAAKAMDRPGHSFLVIVSLTDKWLLGIPLNRNRQNPNSTPRSKNINNFSNQTDKEWQKGEIWVVTMQKKFYNAIAGLGLWGRQIWTLSLHFPRTCLVTSRLFNSLLPWLNIRVLILRQTAFDFTALLLHWVYRQNSLWLWRLMLSHALLSVISV